jgi:hypothetical protein
VLIGAALRGTLLWTMGCLFLLGVVVLSVLPIWYMATHDENFWIFLVLWSLPALWVLLMRLLPIPARWLERDPYGEHDEGRRVD